MSLTLVRGIPGSGKSTLARQLAALNNAVHLEADQYFMIDGEYKFDAQKLHQAHSWCQSSTAQALALGRQVIVSNTFTTLKELKPYFEFARHFTGRAPTVLLAQNQFTNVHNVPEDKLVQMKARFVYDLTPLFEEFKL